AHMGGDSRGAARELDKVPDAVLARDPKLAAQYYELSAQVARHEHRLEQMTGLLAQAEQAQRATNETERAATSRRNRIETLRFLGRPDEARALLHEALQDPMLDDRERLQLELTALFHDAARGVDGSERYEALLSQARDMGDLRLVMTAHAVWAQAQLESGDAQAAIAPANEARLSAVELSEPFAYLSA